MPQLIIKIILIIMFAICWLDMPYGYFQLVRLVGMVSFIYLGFTAHQKNDDLWKYFYWGSALLINPIVKISLGRELWNVVDAVWVVLLAYSVWQSRREL